MSDRPTVRIDPDLSDLLPAFIARKRDDLKSIIKLSGDGDFASVAGIAHKLIGEGGSFGLDAITDGGRRMEQAARARDAATAAAAANELLEYLDSVHIVYSTKDE